MASKKEWKNRAKMYEGQSNCWRDKYYALIVDVQNMLFAIDDVTNDAMQKYDDDFPKYERDPLEKARSVAKEMLDNPQPILEDDIWDYFKPTQPIWQHD